MRGSDIIRSMKKGSALKALMLSVGGLALVVAGGAYAYIKDRMALNDRMDDLVEEIADLKVALLLDSEAVQSRLALTEEKLGILSEEARATALLQEELKKESASQLAELSKEIEGAKASDLSAVIGKWRPFIASVECTWKKPGGGTATNKGSGLLFKTRSNPDPHLVTNRHVVSKDDMTLESCAVDFPTHDGVIFVGKSEIRFSPDEDDIGFIDLSGAPSYVASEAAKISSYSVCGSAASGERVLILGYPSIGAKGDVTATEGIISGVEGDYYITSAKIEQGNSGGAAILVRSGGESCYLGIPTFANVGRIEALARILSAKVLQ